MRARIDLTLPLPPSVNRMLGKATDGHVFRRAHYQRWRKTAGLEFIAVKQSLPTKGLRSGPYGVRVRWPERMDGDVDNRLKALLDFMVWMRITPDDRAARHLSVGFSPVPAPGTCIVRVWSFT